MLVIRCDHAASIGKAEVPFKFFTFNIQNIFYDFLRTKKPKVKIS
jgi:hypothetical protein